MDKKGITPVISLVLLILIMVVLVGGAYYWFTNVQETLQESTGAEVEQSRQIGRVKFDIISISCDSSTEGITISALNTGEFEIDAANAIITVSNINNIILGTDLSVTALDGIARRTSFTVVADPGTEWTLEPETGYSIKLNIGATAQTATCMAG